LNEYFADVLSHGGELLGTHDGNRTSSNFNLPFAPFSRFDSANPSGVRKTEIFSI
jgi:hypothetical protein